MAKKREIADNPPVVDYDNKKVIITRIGYGRKPDERYEIVWPRIMGKTYDELVESARRYGTLQDCLDMCVRNLTTKVDYPAVGFDAAGDLLEGGHEAMQSLADGYQIGRQITGGGSKAVKAATARVEAEVQGKLGMTLEEAIATIAKMKAAGQI